MIHCRPDSPAFEAILSDPVFFLRKIDPAMGRLEFIETSRQILSSAAFIDGRSELSRDGRIYYVDIEAALAWRGEQHSPATPDRFIFHMSFCGSTLLARTCDIAGKAFSYKEPQVLIDLATLKARKHSFYRDQDYWKKLVDLTLWKFRPGWTPDEVSVIKASNWINSILPDLFHCQKKSKAVFLTIDPRKFLIAVFRGGRKRISYSCNFLLHMQTAFPEFSQAIEGAAPLGADPLYGAARLILVACHMQNQAFAGVTGNATAENHCYLGFDDLVTEPDRCLAQVSKTLGLGFRDDDISQSIDRRFKHYSKSENEPYDIKSTEKNDDKIEREFSHVINPALEWYHNLLA